MATLNGAFCMFTRGYDPRVSASGPRCTPAAWSAPWRLPPEHSRPSGSRQGSQMVSALQVQNQGLPTYVWSTRSVERIWLLLTIIDYSDKLKWSTFLKWSPFFMPGSAVPSLLEHLKTWPCKTSMSTCDRYHMCVFDFCIPPAYCLDMLPTTYLIYLLPAPCRITRCVPITYLHTTYTISRSDLCYLY